MNDKEVILDYISNNYRNNCKESFGSVIPFPYVVPGADYHAQLWDWDSWLTGLALMDLDPKGVEKYVKGNVLNFLNAISPEGKVPLLIQEGVCPWLDDIANPHKPCLAAQTLEICQKYHDYSWVKEYVPQLIKYLDYFDKNLKDEDSGLYFWLDDGAIGFDNDPTVFYRQDKSTAAIFLNCLMFNEFDSMSRLAFGVGLLKENQKYLDKANELKEAINRECYDDIDGYYYSVDVSLKKVNKDEFLHSGYPRFWKTLPIKISTWAGMLPLTFGIATPEIASKVVKTYSNENGLFSNYGIRSVAKNEKMYSIVSSGNPSCWLGPIWINANYFTYQGLKRYGYIKEAKDIAEKTIKLLASDVRQCGQFHEYYHPDTGEGVRNPGFQSWNFLVVKMIGDLND